jgi:flagellar biosynthesis protein FliQ
VIVVGGPWMLGQLVSWTQELYASIPSLVGG